MRLIALLLIALMTPSAAAEKTTEEKVYTNEDLERMFGKSKPKPKPKTASEAEATKNAKDGAEKAEQSGAESEDPTKLPDPLVWLQNRLASEKANREAIVAAEQKVARAESIAEDLANQLNLMRLNRLEIYKPREWNNLRQQHTAAVKDVERAKKELQDLNRSQPYGPN